MYKGLAQRSVEAIFQPLNPCQLADNRLLRRANWIELQVEFLEQLLELLSTLAWDNDLLRKGAVLECILFILLVIGMSFSKFAGDPILMIALFFNCGSAEFLYLSNSILTGALTEPSSAAYVRSCDRSRRRRPPIYYLWSGDF